MKTIAIVQARFRSERLPGKVMRPVNGRPLLDYVLARTAKARNLDEVWLACSDVREDDALAEYAARAGYRVFRGSESDVLGRFAALARQTDAQVIVRITGDCPFIDPDVIDRVVERFWANDADFVSNTQIRSWPDGLDVEVFSRATLERADREAELPFLRAHVTPFMHGRLRDRLPWGGFSIAQVVHDADFSHLRWTLDGADDLEFFQHVIPKLPEDFRWQDVLSLLTREPALMRINGGHKLYEGTERDLAKAAGGDNEPRSYKASNALFDRVSEVIPLASQTFSKSYQQWVFGAAPLFLDRARGCRVVDVDKNSYIDYLLGLLPIVLAYGDPDVDAAIEAQLSKGITFSLASPIEFELAEKLIELIPCAEMVRYGKNGSDVTTAAIRLARAHTGRDKVAIGGYHGWHDWYIGTTTRKLGVPEAVRNLSVHFTFNDADELEKLIAADPKGYAAIILEPAGAVAPAPGFLERVRQIADKYGVILVFDEIITGFRINMGGAQKHYGVIPDLACVGKSMGNGMPISALVGRRDIMMKMQDIFFSGTFGGEALSIAAAIATIDKMQRENVIERLWRRGDELRDETNKILEKHGFAGVMAFAGEGWWPRVKITAPPVEANLFTSLWRQEFNANGLILGASFNLCLAHDDDQVIRETLTAIDRSAATVRAALDNADPAAQLRGRPVQPTFSVR